MIPSLAVFLLCGAICVGTFLLFVAVTSRYVCNLPDSIPKMMMEGSLHLLAVGLPVLEAVYFAVEGRTGLLEPPLPAWGQWFSWAFWGVALAVFTGFAGVDVAHWLTGPPIIPDLSSRTIHSPYRKRNPPLAGINSIFEVELVHHCIRFAGKPSRLSGLRIGHLTDIHHGEVCEAGFIDHAVQLLLEQKPDLIAVTGDFVNYRKHLDSCFAVLQTLAAPMGVFAVRGNHDYWVDPEDIERRIAAQGWVLLHDRSMPISWRGAQFWISGIESPWNQAREPLDFIPIDPDRFSLVLSHTPDEFPRLIPRKPDLVLSGHTHGGQICFPFFGPVLVPSNYGRKYSAGFFRERESLLYVSRGIGCYPPLRTLCRPEVTLFEFV